MTALPPAAPPAEAEAAVSVILTRAGNAMSATGERLLVDRLHRFLDDSDADALTTLPEALLDHLRTLVALLPGLVQDDADPRMVETAQTLGALLHQQGIPLRDLVAECIDVYERLLHGFVKDLRDSDRALAAAMIQMSGTMLEIGRHALLAYQENATSSLKMLALSDSLTSLANRRSFDGRFQEELARARRLDRTLALILIDIDGLKTVNDTFGHAAGDRLLSIFSRGAAVELAGHRPGGAHRRRRVRLPLARDESRGNPRAPPASTARARGSTRPRPTRPLQRGRGRLPRRRRDRTGSHPPRRRQPLPGQAARTAVVLPS